MFGMFEPFASHLGLPSLLDHLDDVLSAAKKLNTLSSTKTEAADLIQLIKDLIHIVTSLNDLTTRERRRASARVTSLAEADLIQLQRICTSTAAIALECLELLGVLEPNLTALAGSREDQSRPVEEYLEDQAWYDDIFQSLKLRADVIRILDLAINLLCRGSGTSGSAGSSSGASGSPSLLSTLNYYITSFTPKLESSGQQNASEVGLAVMTFQI